MNNHVEDESCSDGIDQEKPIPQNKSSSESDYRRPAHDDVRRWILEALEEHEPRNLGCVIDDDSKSMVLDLFEEPYEQARRNVHTLIFEAINRQP